MGKASRGRWHLGRDALATLQATPDNLPSGGRYRGHFLALRPVCPEGFDMATFTVTKVRKERADDGSHRHVEGVITSDGRHYSRREVVSSIDQGDKWQTSAGGYTATIDTLPYCLSPSCLASPYITTNPTSTALDNLENLPEG